MGETCISSDCGCSGPKGVAPSDKAAPASTTTLLAVPDMCCPTETNLIEAALLRVPGVREVTPDVLRRQVRIAHDGVNEDALVVAARSTGLAVEPRPDAARISPMALERSVLAIENMDCPTEEALIRKRLGQEVAVHDLSFALMQRRLTIEHIAGALDHIVAVLRSIGMNAVVAGDSVSPAVPDHADGCSSCGDSCSAPIDDEVSGIPASVAASFGESERSVVTIEKMDCPTEEALIRKRLGNEPAVHNLSFNLVQRQLTVDHQPGAIGKVLAGLNAVGMDGTVLSGAYTTAISAATPAKHRSPVDWKLVTGGLAAIAAEGFAFAYGERYWATIALSLFAIALSGVGVFRKGWIAVRQKSLNMNALMSTAVTGAVLIGQWPEAAMVMFLFAVAEAIEAKSLDRARRAVEGLMHMAPDMATVKQHAGWASVPAAQVSVGSTVRARPGERIALDGEVTVGATSIDESPITGESIPVEKSAGSKVFAGTINKNGEIEYRVSAAASQSTLARIIHAVQEAQASRAPTQRFVDTFSKYYTPVVFALAIAVALVPPVLLAEPWLTWVYRALVMLVIACPCALVISTPVTIVSGLTAAAHRGILIKGGVYLEEGHKLKALALDKTGTLTRGKPAVTDVIALEGSEQVQLRIAASLAARSDHPVSRAVSVYAKDVSHATVKDFKAIPGMGVEGVIDGILYRMGNHRLVEESGACSPALEERLDALEQAGKTAIILVANHRPLAIVAIADTVRPQSRDAIAQLHSLGVHTLMLTGDNRHTAEAIGQQVGIEDIRAELLPEQKLAAITVLAAHGTSVGMVGDGINDAPALAKANIGFAMGAAGTDTAIETADVALMDDDPRKLAAFVRLSRSTRAILWQNITLALGIKAVFLALTVVGEATLWMAVFADMGASLIVVFNGMRLLKRKF